jgi:hypothetical protein
MEAENRRVVEINEGIIVTGQGQKNPNNGKYIICVFKRINQLQKGGENSQILTVSNKKHHLCF